MRLFIALELPEETRAAVNRDAREIAQRWTSGRLTAPENYHLTLAFLGEVPADRLAAVTEAMEACPSPPLALAVDEPGRFRQRDGDVIWRKIRGGNALASLQRRLARELERRGFSLEKRPYVPHLTVARKAVFPGDALPGAWEGWESIPFSAEGMTLFRSILRPGGPEYVAVRRFSFQPPGDAAANTHEEDGT